MRASVYLTVAIFASLRLQASLQAQQCDPDYYGRVPFYLAQPYTAEYRERYEPGDGDDPYREDIRVEAQDSQGRRLDSWTSARGSRSHVGDPVAVETIDWNSRSTKAAILEYPSSVAGRDSCWRSEDPTQRFSPDEPPIGVYEYSCPSAGVGQTLLCRDACEAKRRSKALPAQKQGFLPCDSAEPGGTAEDLGMKVIQGLAAHGCRTTTPLPKGKRQFREIWSDNYGLTLRKIEESRHGDRYYEELISLSRDEPDLSTFRPPDGYEVLTLEFDEVPCEALGLTFH